MCNPMSSSHPLTHQPPHLFTHSLTFYFNDTLDPSMLSKPGSFLWEKERKEAILFQPPNRISHCHSLSTQNVVPGGIFNAYIIIMADSTVQTAVDQKIIVYNNVHLNISMIELKTKQVIYSKFVGAEINHFWCELAGWRKDWEHPEMVQQ